MTRVVLIAILLLLAIRAVRMVLRGIAVGSGHQAGRRPIGRGAKLVRDPVCGTHVAPRSTLSLTANGGTHYFCSEECRRKYRGA